MQRQQNEFPYRETTVVTDDNNFQIKVNSKLAVTLINDYKSNEGEEQAKRDLTQDGRLRGIDLKTPRGSNISVITCTRDRYQDFKRYLAEQANPEKTVEKRHGK